MKITENVFEVGGPRLSHMSDASAYAVYHNGAAALIDAGTGAGTKRILTNLTRCGIRPENVKYLFLTHCHYDHTGGAEEIRTATGCKIIAHDLDAHYLESGDSDVTAAAWYGAFMQPLTIDIKVTEKHRTFDLQGLVMDFYHTPGHSPGSAVLTITSEDKLVLFGQDIHGPLNDVLLSNRNDYYRSLEFMMALGADILCEGHFGVYYGKEEVRDFIQSYL